MFAISINFVYANINSKLQFNIANKMNLRSYSESFGKGFGYRLAKHLGVTPASVYQWISGIREIPENRQAEIQTFLACNGLLDDSKFKEETNCAVMPKPQIVHAASLTEIRVAC